MPVILEDAKRTAIASKLEDMKALQNLLISNEEYLLSACSDQEIRDRVGDMLEDDRKNLGILETVIVQYGVKGKPKDTTQQFIEKARNIMQGSEYSLYEKVAEHELLKHKQTMGGLLIHKAAQVAGADIEAAITPLNTVNFENRAHQEQLKGILEILGTRELTGQEPDQGLWARVQDAIAAFTGIAGSAVTRSADEMSIRDIIRMDHTKADTLFMEIERSDDTQKIQEYFGQLYKDLSAHANAEEQVVYPAVRSYYSKTQDLYSEQAEMKQMLEQMRSLNPSAPDFKTNVSRLRDMVRHHKNQEENEMFPIIRDNFSDEQQRQMATEFKRVKSQLQEEMAASMSSRSSMR